MDVPLIFTRFVQPFEKTDLVSECWKHQDRGCNRVVHKSAALSSRDDSRSRDTPADSQTRRVWRIMDCKLKTATGERRGTLHRPPFDFAAVKRIHAYLVLERLCSSY